MVVKNTSQKSIEYGNKMIKFIFILFLFFSFLISIVSLNCKINKLTLATEKSRNELTVLNNQLKESNVLIGEIDTALELPE